MQWGVKKRVRATEESGRPGEQRGAVTPEGRGQLQQQAHSANDLIGASLPIITRPSNARRGDLIIPCNVCTPPAAKVATLSAACAAGAVADVTEGPGSRWALTQFIPPSQPSKWGPYLVDYASVTAAQVGCGEGRVHQRPPDEA
jgi:hypothetical protein